MKPHPARFPVQLPEFFIKFLTSRGDLVLDPFAGSCTTGEAAERLGRRWMCIESLGRYLDGAKFRFENGSLSNADGSSGRVTPDAPTQGELTFSERGPRRA